MILGSSTPSFENNSDKEPGNNIAELRQISNDSYEDQATSTDTRNMPLLGKEAVKSSKRRRGHGASADGAASTVTHTLPGRPAQMEMVAEAEAQRNRQRLDVSANRQLFFPPPQSDGSVVVAPTAAQRFALMKRKPPQFTEAYQNENNFELVFLEDHFNQEKSLADTCWSCYPRALNQRSSVDSMIINDARSIYYFAAWWHDHATGGMVACFSHCRRGHIYREGHPIRQPIRSKLDEKKNLAIVNMLSAFVSKSKCFSHQMSLMSRVCFNHPSCSIGFSTQTVSQNHNDYNETSIHPRVALRKLCHALCIEDPTYEYSRLPRINGMVPHKVVVRYSLPNEEEPLIFEAVSTKRADALRRACFEACQNVKDRFGVFDDDFNIVTSVVDHLSFKLNHKSDTQAEQLSNDDRKWLLKNGSNLLHTLLAKAQVTKSCSTKVSHLGKKGYEAVCELKWPTDLTFKMVGKNKKEALNQARIKAVLHLKQLGYLDDKWQIKLYSEEEKNEMFRSRRQPLTVVINSDLRTKLKHVLDKFETLKNDFNEFLERRRDSFEKMVDQRLDRYPISLSYDGFLSGNRAYDTSEMFGNLNDLSFESKIKRHLITGHRLGDMNEFIICARSTYLAGQLKNYHDSEQYSIVRMKEERRRLPISQSRSEIIKLLDDHQVVIVVGDTGSGKSTQVPQFIFEHEIEKGNGALCNIVVTQPRRISALSLADRIAKERGENVGRTVGYRVRLNHKAPSHPGGILFTTPGMLLQTISSNVDMEGISHVILDEVHERDIWSDFLLILIKVLLKQRKDLKLILMSASVQASTFSKYFNDCPIVNVDGRSYPVDEYFTDDFGRGVGLKLDHSNQEQAVNNCQLIARTVQHIDQTKPPGAILCFLSGWQEIQETNRLLQSRNSLQVLRCHSRLPIRIQRAIFEPARYGKRKVILATNIAESSITVNDVAYVVNSGLVRDFRQDQYDVSGTVSSVRWASRASQIQRKGRAGRVASGECYHLFSKKTHKQMASYETPPILSEPLDQLILQQKLFFPADSPYDFFVQALNAPSHEQVDDAVTELLRLGLIEESSTDLTPLGRRLALFGCSPQNAKILFYATVFRCLSSTAAILARRESNRSLFHETPELKSTIREQNLLFSGRSSSDTVSDANAFSAISDDLNWSESEEKEIDETLNTPSFCSEFIDEKHIDRIAYDTHKGIRTLLTNNVVSTGFVPSPDDLLQFWNTANENSNAQQLIIAVLLGGVGQNLARAQVGQIKGGKIDEKAVIFVDEMNKRARIPSDSCVNDEKLQQNAWLTYFSKVRDLSTNNQMSVLRSISLLHPLAPILFSSSSYHSDRYNRNTLRLSTNHKFLINFTNAKDREYVMLLHDVMNEYVQWVAMDAKEIFQQMDEDNLSQMLEKFGDDLVSVVTDLLCDTAVE